jgi:lipopolysaccharide heptosyltransferase II
MAARPDTPVASFVGDPPDLDRVRKVLLVRLRSIGDTVLMTPCITALKRWRPDVEVDVLLEPFCAPVLEAHPEVARVVEVGRTFRERARAGAALRRRGYDMAVNLNGGSTAAMLAVASGAPSRVGFAGYRQPWLANCRVTSSHDVWRRTDVHTVEHQLALVAGVGVPVDAAGPTSLATTEAARAEVARRLAAAGLAEGAYAVFHPEASLETKRWPADRFARLAATVSGELGLRAVVVGREASTVVAAAGEAGVAMADLSLAETMALVEGSALFVGNDSGPAHVAAAFARPVVVVFGASNAELWRPWSAAPWRVAKGETAADVAFDEVLAAVREVTGRGPTARD